MTKSESRRTALLLLVLAVTVPLAAFLVLYNLEGTFGGGGDAGEGMILSFFMMLGYLAGLVLAGSSLVLWWRSRS